MTTYEFLTMATIIEDRAAMDRRYPVKNVADASEMLDRLNAFIRYCNRAIRVANADARDDDAARIAKLVAAAKRYRDFSYDDARVI